MKITQKNIYLYAVPSDIVPDNAQVNPSAVSIPQGLLPCAIVRADDPHKLGEKLAGLFDWFKANLEPKAGYLPASAALPALSLDKDVWAKAMVILTETLAKYEKVVGPVFVPALTRTRDSIFAVADLYVRMLHGSTLTPVVTYKTKLSTVVTKLSTDTQVVHSNHIVHEDPAVEEVASADLCPGRPIS